MQLSVSKFLDTVEQSGLVEKSQLARTIADLERDSGSEAANDSLIVSTRLTSDGLITEWQRKRLLEGRHAGFFLGKYRLLDHLGTGGMSSVYVAEHPLMRRRVAIKVLPRNRVNDSSYLARFHREARAVAALDHPNIVRAFDVDYDKEVDVHYLVMEYIEGQDLHTLVARDGPLPYRTAAEYIRQAADGLGHAHAAGVVHRDVKPANLLIDTKQVVKLLDMGLARTSDDVDASLTKDYDERMLGTVDYLAPEQALDSHLVDPRADIYSLGCTLYFALTGKPPFPDGTLAQRVLMHQTKEPAEISQMRPDVPASLVAILQRMMAKKTVARYQSAAEVSQALTAWIARYDAGDTRLPAVKHDSDEELKLAPLDDEPSRGRPAAATKAVSSAAEKSATVKSDTTRVDRTVVGKVAVGRSGTLPVAKPISSTVKGTGTKAPTAKPPSGTSSPTQMPPAHAAPNNKPGSSVKNAPAKTAASSGQPLKKPGSSIKGMPTKPATPTAQNAAPATPSSPTAEILPELPPVEALLGPLSGGNLLDDLLSSDALVSGPPLASQPATGQPTLLSGTPLAAQTKKPRGSRLWDSTWFLILVGFLLGLVLVGMFIAWRILAH
jgi:eukaryotic-like serine/threonine-protein kinase